MAGRKKKSKVVRPEGEAAGDPVRVLRVPASIERGHWATGVAPGCCPTCALPDSPLVRLDLSDRQLADRAARFGAPPVPFAAGWRAAEAAAGVVLTLHPELLEREDEDLDGFNVHPDMES